MCFSATASFTASAVLLGIGSLTWRAARHPAERPFAAIPLLFALQQFIEGLIWLSFGQPLPGLASALTYAYAGFSHLLWPVFVPASVALLEPPGWRRSTLMALVAAGAAVSLILLFSIAMEGIVALPSGHHIEYQMAYGYGELTMSLYLLSTAVGLLLSSHATVKAFGLLALLSFALAYAAYALWFVSVWCYFAALLSAVVVRHFHARPRRSPLVSA